ncbi:MAG TPA: DNA translocase FtsK [Anaerolineae bacterium]|nr:DNA translocase FtsK [Anaerolineae bacterium]
MSKTQSPRPAKPKTPKKRRAAPRPQRPAWQAALESNAEIIALIALIALGLLIASQLRQEETIPGIISQIFGWAALPVLVILLLVALAVLARQATQRMGVRDTLPWRQAGEVFIGLALVAAAVLGLSHLWSGSDDPLQYALAGNGGGLAGWLIGSLPGQLLGDLVATGLLLVLAGLGLWLVLWTLDLLALDWSNLPARLGGWLGKLLPAPDEDKLAEPEQTPPAGRASRAVALEDRPSIVNDEPPLPKKPRQPPTKPKAPTLPAQPRPEFLPPLTLLALATAKPGQTADLAYKKQVIEQTLASFNVPVEVVDINVGPTVTQFGVKPGTLARRGPGGDTVQRRVRVSRIRALANDLALALEASTIRIEAPVPGKGYVGIEVPNSRSDLVPLRVVLESPEFAQIKSPLAVALGRDVSGQPVTADLTTMPHLLIAGATGSGKSVCIHSLVCSLLFNNGPDQLRLLLVDPKRVELPSYNGVPHLIAPVITDMDQVVGALTWLTLQMDERYRSFSQVGARNLKDYNRKIDRKNKPAEWRDLEPYPYIVFVVDELADLMLAAPDKVEHYVCRLAQMARATGIHLVIATQRPSVDVITGLIKANFPARIAFSVTSQMDSRVVLDTPGAEKLLGRGDLLFMRPDSSKLDRIQGCFVAEKEIDGLVSFWKQTMPAPELAPNQPRFPWTGLMAEIEDQDDQYERALDLVQGQDRVSTSWLQRRLRVSYNRAAELIARMEEDGYVSSDEGGGRGRQVLLAGAANDEDDWLS